MRDPKITKISGRAFEDIKNAFEDMREASRRVSEIIGKSTGVTDWRNFFLNTDYEASGFYLYQETTCVCGKIHEASDPPTTICMLKNISDKGEAQNIDFALPGEQKLSGFSELPKKH